MKTGVTTLPLHYGSAPRWLFEKMSKLAREISLVIIMEYGVGEYLKKLANPWWFQSFGCVLGFDWHSSGLTTTTCGALKEGLKPLQKELGLFICGGKGKTSRKTPEELKDLGQKFSFNSEPFIYASKITAKVDNNALQDGYQLYHHTFFATKNGQWVVIQQGMNEKNHLARRYHWLSDNLVDFVNEPHSGIITSTKKINLPILNLTDSESKNNREITTKISWEKPEKNIFLIKKLKENKLPLRHQILLKDINPKKLEKIFLKTYENKPKNFESLLGIAGVGPKTIRALSLISELIYGAPASTRDPARFSFAHGGKDGIPYPVDKKTYVQSIEFLKEAVNKAKIGYWEKLHILKKLC
ncbi:MAG: DUF763 domain-containing protein [Microgenomates group bacterium]